MASAGVLRIAAAAAMNASINCMSSEMFPSFSGCHCTPVTHQEWILALEGLDQPVGGQRRHAEVGGELADALVMVAVDPDLAGPVDVLEPGARLHDDGVAMGPALRVAVRDGLGHVLGQVEEEAAAADHVQLLHAQPDAQHGHPRCWTSLQSRRSASSRRSVTIVTAGCGDSPILRGSRSSPPVSITPSSRSRIGARSGFLGQRRDDDRQWRWRPGGTRNSRCG